MDFRFVLVRPRNPNNIGAAARAMANFGFKDLVLVDPFDPVWTESKAALDGEAVAAAARKLPLDEALADCDHVIGTTTARRRTLTQPLVPLNRFDEFLSTLATRASRVAVLFGSEKTGLTGRELDRCQTLLRIPTTTAAPSMNLGQAVAVVAYELAKNQRDARSFGASPAAATDEQKEAFIRDILAAMRQTGYKRAVPPDVVASQLRKSLAQWNMSKQDIGLIHALFTRTLRRAGPRPAE